MIIRVEIPDDVFITPHQKAAAAVKLLDWVAGTNLATLKSLKARGQKIAPLYASRIRYAPERNGEEFAGLLTVYRRGFGDCDDLCAIRVAELAMQGEKAGFSIYWRPRPDRPPRAYHVQVRRANGRIEDPSRLLGM